MMRNPSPISMGVIVAVVASLGANNARSRAQDVAFGSPEVLTTQVDPGAKPRVATDGAGGWIVVWHGGTATEGDSEVYYSRSTDDGMTWSGASPIHSNVGVSDFGASIDTDGAGTWLVAWQSRDPLDGIGSDFDILLSRSTDSGITWSEARALNTTAIVDNSGDLSVAWDADVKIAANREGTWIATWSYSPDGDLLPFDIVYARSVDGGQSWGDPQTLHSNGGSRLYFNGEGDLAADEAGNWIAVWGSPDPLADSIGTDRDILFSRSTDDGLSWSQPAALDTSASSDLPNDELPSLNTNGLGTWIAVWDTSEAGAVVMTSRSFDGGSSWEAPVGIDNGFGARLATDGLNSWILAYLRGFVASIDDGHSWSSPLPLPTAQPPHTVQQVEAAASESGTWLLFVATGHLIEVARSGPAVPQWECVGFEPPLHAGSVTVRGRNRALPLRARLFDSDGVPVTDLNIQSPPVVQILFDSENGVAPLDVTGDALAAGVGTEGNQFFFNDEDYWQLNFKTGDYTAPGTYLIFMDTGDDSEYLIDPTCYAEFIRE